MGSLLVYFGVFAIGALFLNEGRKKSGAINLWSIIGLFVLIMLAAGRYHVGTDYNTYIQMFERYASQSWTQVFTSSEILFVATAKVCYTLGGRVLTWAVFAGLTVIPIYLTIYRQYPKLYGVAAFFSFLCFYYAFSFNITRQFVAIALVIWGMQFVFKNKLLPFLLVITLATGFHLSAPIAGLVWFLWNHKKSEPIGRQKQVFILIMITVIIFGYQQVITYVTGNISLLENYSSYADTSTQGQNRDLFLYIAELAILLFMKGKMRSNDSRVEVMYSLLIISVLIGFTGFTHPQVKRLAYYYSVPSKLILFGYLPTCFTENSKKISVVLICFYAVVYFILTAFVLGQANLMPYQFDLFSAG